MLVIIHLVIFQWFFLPSKSPILNPKYVTGMTHKDAIYKLKSKIIPLHLLYFQITQKLLNSGLLRYSSRSQIIRYKPCLTISLLHNLINKSSTANTSSFVNLFFNSLNVSFCFSVQSHF